MADKISWVDANGTEYVFDTDIKVLSGMNGRFMPPVSFVEDKVPFQDGSKLRQVNIGYRDVDVPIFIKAKDEVGLRNKMRSATRMLNPLKDDGKLKVISPDGIQRELTCRYHSGLEGSEGRDDKGVWFQKAVLVFHAFDPYWYDSNTIVQTFRANESPGLFFPIPPLRLASSTVFADVTIGNTGDVETWPEWIIQGPGENIVIRNLTTDDVTTINYSLNVGETLTVNTRPYHKTVTKQDRTNLFYTLSDDSSLWPLEEGDNSIRIEMSNSTTDSSVQLTYKNRYWGP